VYCSGESHYGKSHCEITADISVISHPWQRFALSECFLVFKNNFVINGTTHERPSKASTWSRIYQLLFDVLYSAVAAKFVPVEGKEVCHLHSLIIPFYSHTVSIINGKGFSLKLKGISDPYQQQQQQHQKQYTRCSFIQLSLSHFQLSIAH